MYSYVYFPDGSSKPGLETSDGWPIIPRHGDLILHENVWYRVKSVAWDYDQGRVDVQCDTKPRVNEQLHYDERTLGVVLQTIRDGFFRGGFTKSGAMDMSKSIVDELQNAGILFRERPKVVFDGDPPAIPPHVLPHIEDMLKGHNAD